MPPRPFPFPLRVGTDICNVARVRGMVGRKNKAGQPYMLHKFLTRVLTQPERTYFWDRFGPQLEAPEKLNAVAEYLAGRFAAKEAIRKACDHFENSARGFHSIIILPVALKHRDDCHKSAAPQGLVLDSPYIQPYEGRDPPIPAYQTARDDVGSTREAAGVVRKDLGAAHAERYTSVADLDGQLCEISISHDGNLATAVALVPSTKRKSLG